MGTGVVGVVDKDWVAAGVLVPQLAPPQGASLACMAGLMTYGRRQFEHLDAAMRRLIPPFHAASAKLTALVDADAQAFGACMVSAQRGQNMVSGDQRRESCVPLDASRHPSGGQVLDTAMLTAQGGTDKAACLRSCQRALSTLCGE